MVLPSTSTSRPSRITQLKNARNSTSKKLQTGISDYLKKRTTSTIDNEPSSAHQQHRSSTLRKPLTSKPKPHAMTIPKPRVEPGNSRQKPLPALPSQSQRQKSPVLTESRSSSIPLSSKILDGVIACLDVRTEDGDDVSQNFERALQSMGAKTRRAFSDSITHLIFKNGSTATLKKAVAKNVHIMNLLWVSRCKREGKRVPESDYIIKKPEGLVLQGTKRRKSMEPGKVKALAVLEPSTSSSSEGSVNEDHLKNGRLAEARRKTIATTTMNTTTASWTGRDFSAPSNESKIKNRFPNLTDDGDDSGVVTSPRLSLPLSVESIANRHVTSSGGGMKTVSPLNIPRSSRGLSNSSFIPVHAPSAQMREHIKARFSIGQISDSSGSSYADCSSPTFDTFRMPFPSPTFSPSRASFSASPILGANGTLSGPPIKRKRRLTGSLGYNNTLPSTTTTANTTISNVNVNIPLQVIPDKSDTKPLK